LGDNVGELKYSGYDWEHPLFFLLSDFV